MQRQFNADVIHRFFNVNGFVQGFFEAVEVSDKLGHAAREVKGIFLAGTFVAELDAEALVEKSQLAEPRLQRIVVEGGVVEDLGVGTEGDLCAGLFADADFLDLLRWLCPCSYSWT